MLLAHCYLCTALDIELAKCSTCFKVNKLSHNVKKTNYIIFNSRYDEFEGQSNCTNILLTTDLLPDLNLLNC